MAPTEGIMDESIIRGLIVGVMFMLIGLVATGIWKLIRSPSEGARRVRWVAGAGLALFTLAAINSIGGVSAVIISLVVLGVIVWVYRGFKNSQ